MWKDDLSEEYKVSPAFKDIGDDINDLAKNFLDAQSHLGNAIRIPGEDATKEAVAEFHTKLQARVPGLIPAADLEDPVSTNAYLEALGKPKKADEYEMPNVNGVEMDPTRETLIRDTALELGMTKKQVKNFLTTMQEADAAGMETAIINQGEALQGLKNEWGVTYTPKVEALTNGLLLTEAPKSLTESIKEGRMPPETVKWLHTIFAKFSSEDTHLTPEDTLDKGLVDVAEASSIANEIRAKLTSNTIQPASEEYKNLLARLLKYEKMAHPNSSSDINTLRAGLRSGQNDA